MKFLNQSLVALLACLPVIWQSVVPLNSSDDVVSMETQDSSPSNFPDDSSNKTDVVVSMELQDSSSSDPLNVPLSQLQNNNLIDLDDKTLFYRLRSERNERLLANPNESENSFPLVYYMIDQMAKWGFEYFQKELEYYNNRDMRIILNKHFFSYNDFELVCKLMDDKKQDWTELELIRLLEIGVECLASGEVKEKLITTVALGIFEERVRETIVKFFRKFRTEINRVLSALRHPSVSIENGILQLDGSKILEADDKITYIAQNEFFKQNTLDFDGDDKTMIMKCFLMRAKTFIGFSFVKFNFTHEIIYQIGEQFKNDSFIFYPYTEQATFCLGKDFGEFSEEIITLKSLSFTAENTKNISSLLTAITKRSLIVLSVFHPEVTKFAFDLNVFLNKIERCHHLSIKSEISSELFEDFYFKMKKLILENVIDNKSYSVSYLNLFSSPSHKSKHAAFFEKKTNIWYWDKRLYLDLTESSIGIPRYEVTDYSLVTAIHLHVSIGKNSYLDLLKKAFDNTSMKSIQIFFYSSFNQFDELIGIIKGKTLQYLTINPEFDEIKNGLKFIDDLINTKFWIKLEHLEIFHVSLEVISKVLDSLPPDLQTLKFDLRESSNGEFNKKMNDSEGESLKYPSVRELKIKAYGYFNYTKDIEQLFLLFPNLERFTFDSCGSLKPFEITNNQLTELSIICYKLEDVDNFIKELINSSTLTLVEIKIEPCDYIKWKKHEGRIYYEICI